MRRERSYSLNAASTRNTAPPLEGGGGEGGEGGAGGAPKNTLEQIVVNTFRTFVQVVVQARSSRHAHEPPASRHEVFSPEASTWLNYYLDCLWAVDEDLTRFWREWKRNERRSTIDLTLDVIANLPGARVQGRTRSSSTKEQHSEMGADQPFLLERWQFSFNAKPTPEARHNTINVKKTAMVLRSVGSIVRVLPAHKLVRLRRKQPTSFSLDYALYPSVSSQLSMPSAGHSPHAWAAGAGRQMFPFSSVVSRHGTFTVTVEYATNLPSLKFQALKIEPFVISDYTPSTDAQRDTHQLTDLASNLDRPRRKSLERGVSLPVFLPSASPMQMAAPSLNPFASSPSNRTSPPSSSAGVTPSSAIPIRGTNHPRAIRGGRSVEEDSELLAMMGTSASPPKLSPSLLHGGLISPTASGGDTLSRRMTGNSGKANSSFNFSSTPPFARDFFLQGYGQAQPLSTHPRASPATHVPPGAYYGISPFLDEKSDASAEGGSSGSRSFETSGSFTEAIFPTLLPPSDGSEEAGEIPELYTNTHGTQPAFAVAIQENEVSSFLDSCARPPDLKMFDQPRNMVASFADELRSLGVEGTEELETLSRSLRRLSTELGKGARGLTGRGSITRDNLDDPLFFDM